VFDESYFKTGLSEHLAAAGAKSTVEVHLMNAHTHRVRSVLESRPAYVVFEAFRQRVDGGRNDQHWQAKTSPEGESGELVRIVVGYESIAEIVITPAEDASALRIGFSRE
jgi:hypothetical protein